MARKVFFSFHYDRDVRRVVQVRNSWVVRLNGEAQPFFDKAEWETVKQRGIEAVRSQSHAVRNLNLVSNLRHAIEQIGGTVEGIGPSRAIYIRLPDGRNVVVFPTVGVPTSTTLHDAMINAPDHSVAVIYDHIGLHPTWLGHLDWLGNHIQNPRWVKASEAAWQFADWESSL